jgi:alkylation response protein AidB-like acyl-CoA dehydrogenase
MDTETMRTRAQRLADDVLFPAALEKGELRGGIALAGARGGRLRAPKVDGGYLLDGTVPWVTGWDMVHVLQVAALDGDEIAFLLMDVAASETLLAEPVHLVAANASRTVTLHFRQHFVPEDRFTGAKPYAEWQRNEASGSALNGCLALGVARRCSMLMDGAFGAEIEACRALLLGADIPQARATASELAIRAASTLIVHTGSRAVLMHDHAQRLMREAAFLLVFGTRPLIRASLLGKLSR